MVNLSKVTHTCICGTPNEHVASIVASVVETSNDASIGVDNILLEHRNYKTSYNKIWK
jgi:hypothetical protein